MKIKTRHLSFSLAAFTACTLLIVFNYWPAAKGWFVVVCGLMMLAGAVFIAVSQRHQAVKTTRKDIAIYIALLVLLGFIGGYLLSEYRQYKIEREILRLQKDSFKANGSK